MAWIVKGLSDERIELLGFHAMLTQLRIQAQTRQKFTDEPDRALIRFRFRSLEHVEAASDADAAIKPWFLRRAKFHSGDQAERVGQTMVQTAEGRERMRQ